MKKDYVTTEKIIIDWGNSNQDKVNEIYVIGSLSSLTMENNDSFNSDYDLLIFINDSANTDKLYSELSSIGLSSRILIHPLLIKESERELKLSIKQYADALSKKRKIFSSFPSFIDYNSSIKKKG